VRRILEAKARAGLHNDRAVSRPVLDYLLALPRGEPLAQAAADKAVTLLKNDGMLPLNPNQKAAVVQLTNTANSESIEAAMDLFTGTLRRVLTVSDSRLGSRFSQREVREVRDRVREADALVIVLYLRLSSGRGDAGLYAEQEELVDELIAMGKPVTVITLGNPYAVTPYTDADALMVAYEQSFASVRTLTRIVLGEHHPSGRLPITVGPFAYGSGLDYIQPERFAYGE
jgi:beta-N-acetylhexosaminidase